MYIYQWQKDFKFQLLCGLNEWGISNFLLWAASEPSAAWTIPLLLSSVESFSALVHSIKILCLSQHLYVYMYLFRFVLFVLFYLFCLFCLILFVLVCFSLFVFLFSAHLSFANVLFRGVRKALSACARGYHNHKQITIRALITQPRTMSQSSVTNGAFGRFQSFVVIEFVFTIKI